MNILGWITYIMSTCSFCLCVLRMKCQVLEKESFSPDIHLTFDKCGEFELLNYKLGVNCDNVEALNESLVEVPLETDWLCLSNYKGRKIETAAFSQLTNLQALYITGNVELLSRTFSGLSQLSTLWIILENISTTITFHKDTFDGLNNLLELKLFGVQFSALDTSIFNNLHHLEHLILENNSIRFLSTVTKSLGRLKTLQKLSIIDNDIDVLRKEDCLHSEYPAINGQYVYFNVSVLDLSMNKLQLIENNSLCNFPHLSLFKANKTGIQTKQMFQSGIRIILTVSLTMTDMHLMELCEYSSYFKVKELLLGYNSVFKINTYTGTCTNLEKIDLSHNLLEGIYSNQIKTLKDLVYLDVSFNRINVLDICPVETLTVFSMKLEHLNISFNYVTSLSKGQFSCLQNLQVLSLEYNKIYTIEDFAFDGVTLLTFLNLENNNLFEITNFTFYSLFSLKQLNLYENSLTDTEPGAFFWFNKLEDIRLMFNNILDEIWWSQYIDVSVQHISVKTSNTFLSLLSENFNKLSNLDTMEIESKHVVVDTCQEFVFTRLKEIYLRDNLFCTCFGSVDQAIGNFTNLEKLSYDANSQDSTDIVTLNSSLQYLKKLAFLRIENTDKLIGRAPINVHELFHGLSNLKILHLKNSGINHFDSAAIFSDLNSLEFLLIENQDIQEMNEYASTSMPNLSYIYFKNVIFACNCKFGGLLSWLEYDTRASIINAHAQNCFINSIETNMLSFLRSNCQYDSNFRIFISTFSTILVFMCISIFHESIWWYSLYLFYTVKCWLNHRLRGMEEDLYRYDAFVSYNTHDEQWITEHLLPNLEQNGPPFLRVCIHNRDFEIGRDIVENIVDSIYKSRWTICLITRSYLQSHWCSLEMRMATYRLVAESKDSLIFIFLDKISREELQCYHRLTKLLDKKTYLEWPHDLNGQELFWARLRQVIGG
ncbi:toll-like receptor 13 [Pelobates cultripes]|uniref:Toll-like receptor 13 n=1 Tax=Pelobates cultripes TaxID=61616 RepID=A0AAD1TCT2_PELCU|nr:toll-like receptor 13 [Pelobates cultripes]